MNAGARVAQRKNAFARINSKFPLAIAPENGYTMRVAGAFRSRTRPLSRTRPFRRPEYICRRPKARHTVPVLRGFSGDLRFAGIFHSLFSYFTGGGRFLRSNNRQSDTEPGRNQSPRGDTGSRGLQGRPLFSCALPPPGGCQRNSKAYSKEYYRNLWRKN